MRVTLDTQEIMKAISVYMALKGYVLKHDHINFNWDSYVKQGNVTATFDVERKYCDTEAVKRYANR